MTQAGFHPNAGALWSERALRSLVGLGAANAVLEHDKVCSGLIAL
jgi:hypothetical protein